MHIIRFLSWVLIMYAVDGGAEKVIKCDTYPFWDDGGLLSTGVIFFNVHSNHSTPHRLECNKVNYHSAVWIVFESASMEEIPKNLFELFKVKRLDLPFCEITHISQGSLENANQMSKLNLTGNHLSVLHNFSFTGAGQLIVLDLSKNSISVIESETFQPLNHLTELYLSGNKLRTLQAALFENNAMLRKVFLQNNLIHSVHQKAFPLKNSVSTLDLSFNKLEPLRITTFARLVNLEQLYLQDTQLSHIQHGTFGKQKRLKVLDIAYNRLETIEFMLFVSLRSLETLYLDGNALYSIDYEYMTAIFPSLRAISLANNNWRCSLLVELVLFCEQNTIKLLHRGVPEEPYGETNVEGFRCYGTEEMPISARKPTPPSKPTPVPVQPDM